ncbi:hypothetical protein R3P38DRAFT_2812333 [Favolaschia claudopus]|uniref:Uncharacterized protein n=1 Tax=Favolaschia claudopus TaxID=2862362 RepID=A0AAV9Z7C8_9AGAR
MTRSGSTWDEDFGANVITQTEQDVWEGGWLPYRAIEKLDPAKPKGDNSFRPRIGIVGNDAVLSAPTGASSASIAGPSVPPPSNTPPYVDSSRLSPDWDLHELEQNGTQPNDNSQPPGDSASSPIVGGALRRNPTLLLREKRKPTHMRSVDEFGVHFSKATGGLTDALNASNTNSSPERRSHALALVAKESWLDLPDRIKLGSLVGDGQLADEYMAWARAGERERKTWVSMKLGYSPDYYKNMADVEANVDLE